MKIWETAWQTLSKMRGLRHLHVEIFIDASAHFAYPKGEAELLKPMEVLCHVPHFHVAHNWELNEQVTDERRVALEEHKQRHWPFRLIRGEMEKSFDGCLYPGCRNLQAEICQKAQDLERRLEQEKVR